MNGTGASGEGAVVAGEVAPAITAAPPTDAVAPLGTDETAACAGLGMSPLLIAISGCLVFAIVAAGLSYTVTGRKPARGNISPDFVYGVLSGKIELEALITFQPSPCR